MSSSVEASLLLDFFGEPTSTTWSQYDFTLLYMLFCVINKPSGKPNLNQAQINLFTMPLE